MKGLTLKSIAKACGGILKNDNGNDAEASCVVIDSRLITEGGIFIATVGERVDGHSFIPDVASKGALGVICEKEPSDCSVPYILVNDSFKALTDVAAYYRSILDIPVIGITGSVGKTSTKEFIAATLSARYNVLKTQGNFNNAVGMPLTLLSIRKEHEIAVVEMGISDFGEMSELASVSKPDTCVITNIGKCHLEKLIDRDGVLKEKTQMLKFMNPQGAVIFNGDDDKLISFKKPYEREITYFGMQETNDVYAADIVNKGLLGSEASVFYNMNGKSGKIDIKISLPGDHMIYNVLSAVAVGIEYGLSENEIKEGLSRAGSTSGRSNIIRTEKYTIIDDCYNANPASMKAAIDLLDKADTRKVAILGDMFELGADEAKLHSSIGEYAFLHGVDILITIGDLSKNMYEAAKNGADGKDKAVYYFKTKEEAMEELPGILRGNDSILIKASHGMHFEKIVESLTA
ncbi:MAG: UDP-N-acetylmuramoyl-tripeptide--D-alanyl-D-alanine ligase [Lachnospiraceae bacterium]|nr:UDP-N-acetylmuramoyl-tripeptide--D-alanyl-D-alanine ligase [Lachnospiraceae bacterium]